jgi:hypothetical protein
MSKSLSMRIILASFASQRGQWGQTCTEMFYKGPVKRIRWGSVSNKISLQWTGGGRGIRTPGCLSTPAVFKTAAINRSAIPPPSKVPDFVANRKPCL